MGSTEREVLIKSKQGDSILHDQRLGLISNMTQYASALTGCDKLCNSSALHIGLWRSIEERTSNPYLGFWLLVWLLLGLLPTCIMPSTLTPHQLHHCVWLNLIYKQYKT